MSTAPQIDANTVDSKRVSFYKVPFVSETEVVRPPDNPIYKEWGAKEEERAIKKVAFNYQHDYYKSLDVEVFSAKFPGIMPSYVVDHHIEKVANQYERDVRLDSRETVALLVTFRPSDERKVDFKEMHKLARLTCKISKGVYKSLFCLEQTGLTQDEWGHGLHFHALIMLDHGEIMGQVARQKKRIIALLEPYKTTSPRFLDFKRVSAALLTDKVNYIKGEKRKEDKQAGVIACREWRSTLPKGFNESFYEF